MDKTHQLMMHALSTELGVEIHTTDSALLQRRFHVVRDRERKKGNTSLDKLRCRVVSANVVFFINSEGCDDAGNRESDTEIIPGGQGQDIPDVP